MPHGIGLAFLVAAIAFAFGERAARAFVGAGLVLCAVFFGGLVVLSLIGWFD